MVPGILKQQVLSVRKVQISPKELSPAPRCRHARFPDVNPSSRNLVNRQLSLSRCKPVEQFVEDHRDGVIRSGCLMGLVGNARGIRRFYAKPLLMVPEIG